MAETRTERRARLSTALDGLPATEDEALDAIAEMRADPRVDDVRVLLPYVFAEAGASLHSPAGDRDVPISERLRAAAAALLRQLVTETSVSHLPKLELAVRRSLWGYGYSRAVPPSNGWMPASVRQFVAGWRDRPSALARRWAAEWREHPALLALLSFHANGFFREAAVRILTAEHSEVAFPFLLLRANDWVPQVRRVASDGIEAVISRRLVATVAASAPLVLKLSEAQRVDHSALVLRLTNLLAAGDGEGLIHGLASRDRFVRRAVVQLAGSLPSRPLWELVNAASADPDVVVRAWAARQLEALESTSPEHAKLLRDRLLADPAASIRRVALYSLLRMDRHQALRVLPSYLLHPSRSLRRVARFYLTERTREGAAWTKEAVLQTYRSGLLGPPSRQAVAAAALGEAGERSDLPALRSLLHEGSAKPARTALRSIARLDENGSRDLLCESLGDPRGPVRREACRLLGARLRPADVGAVRAAITACTPPDPTFVIRVVRKLPEWQRLILLLQLSSDEDYRPASADALAAWRTSVRSEAPTESEWRELAEGFGRASRFLPQDLRRHLESQELPFGEGFVFRRTSR